MGRKEEEMDTVCMNFPNRATEKLCVYQMPNNNVYGISEYVQSADLCTWSHLAKLHNQFPIEKIGHDEKHYSTNIHSLNVCI